MLVMLLRALAASVATPAPRTLPSLTLVSWQAAATPAVTAAAALQTRTFGSNSSRRHAAAAAADAAAASTHLKPPTEPDPSECCGRGCATCVWTTYHEDLLQYNIDLAVQQGRPPPEDPFAALERKLEQQRQEQQQEAELQREATEQREQGARQGEAAEFTAAQQKQAQQETKQQNAWQQQEAWQPQEAYRQEDKQQPGAARLDSDIQAPAAEPTALPSMPDASLSRSPS